MGRILHFVATRLRSVSATFSGVEVDNNNDNDDLDDDDTVETMGSDNKL